MVSKIVETAETIIEFPELDRVVPEIGTYAIRERFVHSYRIEDDRILIAALIHGSRLLQPFLQRVEGDDKPGT